MKDFFRSLMLGVYFSLAIRRAGGALAFALIFGIWAPLAAIISIMLIVAPIVVPVWVEDWRWSQMVREINARSHAQR